MSIVKLYGLTPNERQSLQRRVAAERLEEGRPEELGRSRPDDEVWVVNVSAAQNFREANPDLPAAVLCGRGKSPIAKNISAR
jgi:hypothetical protein